ncbi:MAG: helix-turn-helix domain-containing protein [Victivallaceae bacterium]|nr:helix-turn-helix domain-containing protein [Victivallaceae bacterium]
MIEQALNNTGGNKARAAEILQIDRKALYRKMRRLELF